MAKTILRHEGITAADLSCIFVTDRTIQALNKKYLKRNHPTDVLAFDYGGGTVYRVPMFIGEIIISAEAAVKNAKLYRSTVQAEIALYLIHGLLHLLGYDDHSHRDRRRMRDKEKELLEVVSKPSK